MTFTIPDLTPDARPWRVDWFGEVAYPPNSQRRSQPIYRVLISPVLGNLSAPNIVTDDGDQREAWLSIGTLSVVSMGDIWQSGEKISQPNYQQESFGVHIAHSSANIIKAGMSLDEHFVLPLKEHRWHRGATQSYCTCISMKDGKRLVVPCMELIRFYFGTSSNVLHRLFTNTPNTLINLDPPYFGKGPELYTNFYQPDDHAILAKAVCSIQRHWMVTYDDTPEIRNLYKQYATYTSNLNYSAQLKRVGTELLVLGPSLSPPHSIKLAKLKDDCHSHMMAVA